MAVFTMSFEALKQRRFQETVMEIVRKYDGANATKLAMRDIIDNIVLAATTLTDTSRFREEEIQIQLVEEMHSTITVIRIPSKGEIEVRCVDGKIGFHYDHEYIESAQEYATAKAELDDAIDLAGRDLPVKVD